MSNKPRSFARRLSLRLFLAMLVVNVFIIAFVCFFVFLIATVMNSEHYQTTIAYTSEKLRTMLKAIEVSAVNSVDEIEGKLNDPDAVFSALSRELRLNDYVTGYFAAFEPDYYPSQGRWFEPYVARRDSTTLEQMQIGSATHDYLQRDWYQKGLKAEEGYWTDTYFDAEGAKAMLCSYLLPLHDQKGRTVGIFGADLPLEWLTKQVRLIEEKDNDRLDIDKNNGDETIRCFIIGRDGQYIVHPEKDVSDGSSFLDDVKASPEDKDDELYQSMVKNEQGFKRMKRNGVNSYVYYSPVGQAGWEMAIIVPEDTMFVWGFFFAVTIMIALVVGMLVVFFVSRVSIMRVTKPLRFLNETAKEVAKGRFDVPMPRFKRNDEISELSESFGAMQKSLARYVDELKATTTSKASMESELRIAHDIQMEMLPKTFPPFPERNDVDLFGQLTPAKAVGGDLYDFYIRDEKLFFCIGDVSGKGVPASMVMAVTRSLFRNISAHTSRPEHITSALNTSLSEGNKANMFVTLFVGVLDLPTGRLHYCNAGHDAPLVIKSLQGEGFFFLPVESNLPLGIISDWKFVAQEAMITPDTTIFLYTDGLTEAENSDHAQFTAQRITEVAATVPSQPRQLIAAMIEAVTQFVGGAEQSDDLTMLAVQYTKRQLAIRFHDSLTLPNDVQTIPHLAEFVDRVCEAAGFGPAETFQLNLAIEEAVVNVMNYAYPKNVSGEVRIEAQVNDERMKFVVTDSGTPFDPTAHKEADTTLTAEERSIGGLGIHLVRKIMDSINYEYTDGQNIFTMRKKLPKGA